MSARLPRNEAEWEEFLNSLSDEELEEIYESQQQLEERMETEGPQTDDELHAYIKDSLGIDIPRVAVCEGHDAPFQFVADVYFGRVTAVLVMGARSSGKCLAGDSLVLDPATGALKQIKEIVENPDAAGKILTVDSKGSMTLASITARWNTGVNKTLRVRTASGRVIETTYEHPFLTGAGWKRADELENGQRVAMPARLPHPSAPADLSDGVVDLLAVLLAEGCYTQRAVTFSTADDRTLKLVEDACAAEFNDGTRVVHASNYDYRIARDRDAVNTRDGSKSQIRLFLEAFGIAHEGAADKKIPDAVFSLSEDKLARFLSVFWMCDGYVSANRSYDVGITLSSKTMVEQIQHLLLRFGVQSSVRPRNGGRHYRLTVYKSCFKNLLSALRYAWGSKLENLIVLSGQDIIGSSAGKPELTPALLGEIVRRVKCQTWHERREASGAVRAALGLGAREQASGKPASVSPVKLFGTSGTTTIDRDKLRVYCDAGKIGDTGFEMILSDDLWWDPIVSIEDAGEQVTYDLTMEPTANFIANDFLVHNTFLVAVLHWVNSKFKPGIESCTFGAIDAQSFRAYGHLKNWINDEEGNLKPEIVSSLMRETMFRNGSKIEVLGSTPAAVNGPHPNVVHGDEVEQMRDDTWKESRNMSRAGMTRDGRKIFPQDILTSTRKGPSGRMQELIDEIEEAEREGFEPPRKLYAFCIKEAAAENPACRRAPKDEREARLKELGMDPCSLCDCHKVRKGMWTADDEKENPERKANTPRTLDQICDGGFFRSRGHEPIEEVKKHFRENDKTTFEVQQLCSKAEMKYHYVPNWKDAHHCVRNFVPDPDNGPIWTSTDWGGTNPHSVHWYQLLKNDTYANSWVMTPNREHPQIVIKQGSIVCFDEIYIAEISNEKLGAMVKKREAWWSKQIGKPLRVRGRFADPQGKSARIAWRDMGLKCEWHVTREFEEHIKTIHSYFDDDLFRVAGDRCEMFVKEVKAWRRDEKTGDQLDEFNHAMSDFRYAMENIKRITRKMQRRGGDGLGGVGGRQRRRVAGVTVKTTGSSHPVTGVANNPNDQFARWRQSLGVSEGHRRR